MSTTQEYLPKIISINANFPKPQIHDSFDPFLSSIEQMIQQIIQQYDINSLPAYLPIITCSPITAVLPITLSLALISFEKFSSGLDQYFDNMISRWLIPGKQLEILAKRSLSFRFFTPPSNNSYFFHEIFICLTQEKDLHLAQKNIPTFLNELKLNISAVNKAKALLLSENLLLDRFETPSTLHGQLKTNDLKEFLRSTAEEKKLTDITQHLSRIMERRPKIFDRDIFSSMHNVSLLFNNNFTNSHNAKHISRIIALYYLFANNTKKNAKTNPHKRHISFKVVQINNNQSPFSLGILLSFNLLQETEKFEKIHFQQVIEAILGKVNYKADSFICDKNEEKIRTIYIEILLAEKIPSNMVKKLRQNLSVEVIAHIENSVNPIFMPRNDEELFHNVIILSKQLRYAKDLPQAIISFEKQTAKQIFFTVILLRLLKENSLSLKELFLYSQSQMTYTQDEVKIVGYLKKKYPKELNIFCLSLDKTLFFRKDFTIDLQKARQVIAENLEKIIGPYRDFNGGLILKQNEILKKLKKALEDEKQDLLIENFFHSISPSMMKNILPFNVLKYTFEAYYKALNSPLNIWQDEIDRYILTFKKTTSFGQKEKIDLELPKAQITKPISSYLETNNHIICGYLTDKDDKERIYTLLKNQK